MRCPTREAIDPKLKNTEIHTELSQRVEDTVASEEASRYAPGPPYLAAARGCFELTKNFSLNLKEL